MVKTYSKMIALGQNAVDFVLPDVVSGKNLFYKHDDAAYKATVLMFICNHCPFVKYINQGMVQLALDYQPKDIRFIAINANDAEQYPDDSPENMKKAAQDLAYPFPYLYDQTQEIAKAYNAACTPDFFIYDAVGKLVYRGQFDDARPGSDIPITGESIRSALDSILTNTPVSDTQKPSIGCNIKWKLESVYDVS